MLHFISFIRIIIIINCRLAEMPSHYRHCRFAPLFSDSSSPTGIYGRRIQHFPRSICRDSTHDIIRTHIWFPEKWKSIQIVEFTSNNWPQFTIGLTHSSVRLHNGILLSSLRRNPLAFGRRLDRRSRFINFLEIFCPSSSKYSSLTRSGSSASFCFTAINLICSFGAILMYGWQIHGGKLKL